MFLSDRIQVPFQLQAIESEGYHVLINALINGQPARLLIDTGASRSVFDADRYTRFVKNHEFRPDAKLSAGLGTSSMQTMEVVLDELRIEGFYARSYHAILLDMGHVNSSYERLGLPHLDGVVGSDLLVGLDATIDYRKKRITINKKLSPA